MPSYIVPAAGQKLDPVVRRVVGYAKQVGENVRIDRSTPRPRLEVGPKTLARWRETNAARLAADRAAHAGMLERRAAAAEPPAAPTKTEPAWEPASAAAPESAPAPSPEQAEAPSRPSKKTTATRKRKPSARKTTGKAAGSGQ